MGDRGGDGSGTANPDEGAATTPDLSRERILVTGALGQIGTELVLALRARHGRDSVVTSDLRAAPKGVESGPHRILDVLDRDALDAIVREERIGTIHHLAAILSATGEMNPELCERINLGGLTNVLEVAREHSLRVFSPSSIAVFGPSCPAIAPQGAPLDPTTTYGETKVTGERLAREYWDMHGVDVRGLRYPGLVSWRCEPGGGTTDYAVDIFRAALKDGRYTCFVRSDTCLPMMYMDDAIRATLELMDAPGESLSKARGGYNVAGASFSAGELAEAIARRVPGFQCSFKPDIRQTYADSWPDGVDDTVAREEWGWTPGYDLDAMVDEMIRNLRAADAPTDQIVN